jgi:hypothetical protein
LAALRLIANSTLVGRLPLIIGFGSVENLASIDTHLAMQFGSA